MPKYGTQFSSTDPLKKADGRSHDAAERTFANYFDLAIDGNTNQSLKVCDLPRDVVPMQTMIQSDQNLSALTFTVGTIANPTKYGAATAGPVAGGTVIIYPPMALKIDAVVVQEEVFIFPSAAVPVVGGIRARFSASKR